MISYIGGKSNIGRWIRDYIPSDIETYVETFGGMFWVYFCMEDKYPNLKEVVYNDFNPLNYNLFKKIIKRRTIVDQNITIKGVSKVYKKFL